MNCDESDTESDHLSKPSDHKDITELAPTLPQNTNVTDEAATPS